MFFHFCCSTLSEKRTLDNLNASMKAASEILERRRSERRGTAYSGTGSTSRYVGADYSLPFPPDHLGTGATERGRPTSRYSLPMQPPPTKSYRSSSGSVDTSGSAGSGSSSHHATSGAGGTGTGNSLWGLLDMAQSWIMTHTSRRDRSEERSRYLLRKTKPVWFMIVICEQITNCLHFMIFFYILNFISTNKPIYHLQNTKPRNIVVIFLETTGN